MHLRPLQTRDRLMALMLFFGVALSGVALAVTSMAMSKNEKLLIWSVMQATSPPLDTYLDVKSVRPTCNEHHTT